MASARWASIGSIKSALKSVRLKLGTAPLFKSAPIVSGMRSDCGGMGEFAFARIR